MKREVVALAAVLSLALAAPAFAIEGSQPSREPAANFEQMKADHLKKLDERITSLQQEKACAQAAQNKADLKACRLKHMTEMKEHRGEMLKEGPGGRGGQVPPKAR